MFLAKSRVILSLAVVSLCFFSNSYAAITPADNDIQVFQPSDSALDIVKLSPPNAGGISINRFSQFVVDSQPLHILNTADTVRVGTNDVATKPAELIVIMANNINLSNHIKVIGATSDILFIATGASGTISCNSCDFSNIMRLSLATTSTSPSESSAQIGAFKPSAASRITINNLDAPGAIGVDMLTANLSLNGTVNTHQPAVQDSKGGYTVNSNGNFAIGSGITNIMLGDITWHYDNNQMTRVGTAFSGSHNLSGMITSTGVKISSADSIALNTKINTSSNLLSALSYQGGSYLPAEGVDVQTFANKSLTINTNQINSSSIKLKATGQLLLNPQAGVRADDIELVAGTQLTNLSYIKGKMLNIAGDSFINEGVLEASVDLNAWAYKQLANQYGGVMKGNTIRLESVTQAVRNGSRTPYISSASETNSLLNYNNYINTADSDKRGTFYQSTSAVNTSNAALAVATNNSAKISANQIEIKAVGFENINPYYVKVTDPESVVLKTKYVGQVFVSAEDYLSIKASNYVTNSSAHLWVNSSTGVFKVDTALFTNERYRLLNSITRKEGHVVVHFGFDGMSILDLIENVTYETVTVSYSPPAILSIAGDSLIKASQGIVNNTAYFELLGNAQFDTPVVNDIGLQNQSIHKLQDMRYFWCPTDECDSLYPSETLYAATRPTFTVSTTQELDSLFSIRGDLTASTAMGWFRNHKPLDSFIKQAIANVGGDTSSPTAVDAATEAGIIQVGSNQYYLFEELEKVYQSIKNTIANFFAELEWWN